MSDANRDTENSADRLEGSAEVVDTRGTPAFFEYWNQMDFVTWMGARVVESADGYAKVYFEPGQHHRGAGVGRIWSPVPIRHRGIRFTGGRRRRDRARPIRITPDEGDQLCRVRRSQRRLVR